MLFRRMDDAPGPPFSNSLIQMGEAGATSLPKLRAEC